MPAILMHQLDNDDEDDTKDEGTDVEDFDPLKILKTKSEHLCAYECLYSA